MSRSSTSSSEPVRAALIGGWPVLLAAVCVVLAGEIVARIALGDDRTWEFWTRSIALKVELVEEAIDAGVPPELLVVGDSSAANNLVPGILEDVLGLRTFNLGTPGNVPADFDVTVRAGILEPLDLRPRVVVACFSGWGFDHRIPKISTGITSAPLARRVRGERVWGDVLGLVRANHRIRLQRTRAPVPTIARNAGWERFPQVLVGRRHRPDLAVRLPAPPKGLVKPPRVVENEADPFEPLVNLLRWTDARGARLVVVTPPTSRPTDLAATLGPWLRERGAVHLDHAALPLKQHSDHMEPAEARVFSRIVAAGVRDGLGL